MNRRNFIVSLFSPIFAPLTKLIPKYGIKKYYDRSGLFHLATFYYKKSALDRLNSKFLFTEYRSPEYWALPEAKGKKVTWYRYSNFNPDVGNSNAT